MLRLNEDVLFLLFGELKDDKKSIYSCLLVDKTWCKIAIKILWKNPWENFGKKQLNIILSNLSSKTKETLRSQGINLLPQKPLFNYIGFFKYLNIHKLQKTISAMNINESIENEILDLFINNKTKFTHLSIPTKFNYQMDPNSEVSCFSELKFLQFNNNINQEFLEGLAKMSTLIKELKFVVTLSNNNSSETIRLIEAQKNLNNVHFTCHTKRNESFCKLLEESLIEHADTIQHLTMGWKPITKILSNLINLISLELKISLSYNKSWDHLENLSLPVLKILKVTLIPSKILARLIESTNHLTEINIYLQHETDNKMLIQAIYQNSSENLKYLEVRLMKNIISEFETLLINCQNLDGLIIITGREDFDWNILFKTLTKSSPPTLFKFKFCFYFDEKPSLEYFESFFNNWKDRYPMLLQTFQIDVPLTVEYSNLFEIYKTKGIIKKYDYNDCFENFEWIYKRSD